MEDVLTSISTTAVSSQAPQMGFLTLPVELRLEIYAYLFHLCPYSRFGPSRSNKEEENSPHGAALLRTCRLIHEEATPFLYADNTFIAHPSLLASFPRLRPHLSPVSDAGALSRIRRFDVTLRLDCDPPFTADAAVASFSGVDELVIHIVQASFLAVGCANLRLFEGVRGVAAVSIVGSTTGFEEYVAWLRGVMTAPIGADVGKFVPQRPSLVDLLAIRFYV